VLARELTKLHEQFRRGTLAELRRRHDAEPPSGEMVLLIAGHQGEQVDPESTLPLADEVDQLTAAGSVGRNEAIKQVARRRGLARREAYRIYLEERMIADDANDSDQSTPDQS
ncbi:MAG: hypothetical protein ACKOB4_13360, partial [Acidobacteriota bacterium]